MESECTQMRKANKILIFIKIVLNLGCTSTLKTGLSVVCMWSDRKEVKLTSVFTFPFVGPFGGLVLMQSNWILPLKCHNVIMIM
jgi:hypothetical protein